MKNYFIFTGFLLFFNVIFTEMEDPVFLKTSELFHEKEPQNQFEQKLRQKAEQNYRNKLLLVDARKEKYVKNAKNLSLETQRLLVSPQDHQFSTQADIDRIGQEIAREKNRSSKLWFNSDKSSTLIQDLQDLQKKLKKQQGSKSSQSFTQKSDSTGNLDTKFEQPATTYFESEDVGSKIEDNPLSPKQHFDYDQWKKELLEKQKLLEDEQKQITKTMNQLKKQNDYQQNLLFGIQDQQNEIIKKYSKKSLSPEHIDYISTELVHTQAEVKKLEEQRSESILFKTLGNHENNEKIQELNKTINTWKDEITAYDQLAQLKEQESAILAKIKDIRDQQTEHTKNLHVLDEKFHDLQSSINNADFHLKRIDKYLNNL